mmetsp:Transcript_73207/g.136804  ORF Transcript_73207/g.136804 Transcript_73207/m.136804 type:complete len:281 (+) Transcript_73207:103-945(+)
MSGLRSIFHIGSIGNDDIVPSASMESVASSEGPGQIEYTASTAAEVESLRSRMKLEMWDVTIDRLPGKKAGARWLRAFDDSALVITKISEDSLLSAWNDAHPDQLIRCGDLILEINGVSVEALDMDEDPLATVGPALHLHLVRLVEFPAHLDLSAGPLGIYVDDNLVVTSIKSRSTASVYNRKMPPELQIRPGDRLAVVEKRTWEEIGRPRAGGGECVELLVQRPFPGVVPKISSQRYPAKPPSAVAGFMGKLIGSFPPAIRPSMLKGLRHDPGHCLVVA